ncbi:Tigger transposable element-derived protein 6 [Dictyocoela muelleri]|nr:Tigger transposable element-derived protein 6 [Dictyocoela muelleri]
MCFLPPNSTAFYQPLDSEIIRSFKASFKNFLLRYVLLVYENNKPVNECFKDINLRNVITFCKWEWDRVSRETIINFRKKSGLVLKTPRNRVIPINYIIYTNPVEVENEVD